MTLLEAITAKLGEAGWTQSDLARATGIHKQHISAMLKGKRPITIQSMLVIDHALALGLDYGKLQVSPRELSHASRSA